MFSYLLTNMSNPHDQCLVGTNFGQFYFQAMNSVVVGHSHSQDGGDRLHVLIHGDSTHTLGMAAIVSTFLYSGMLALRSARTSWIFFTMALI